MKAFSRTFRSSWKSLVFAVLMMAMAVLLSFTAFAKAPSKKKVAKIYKNFASITNLMG